MDHAVRDARPDRLGGVQEARLHGQGGVAGGGVFEPDRAARHQDAQRDQGAPPGRGLRLEGRRLRAGSDDREAEEPLPGGPEVEREPQAGPGGGARGDGRGDEARGPLRDRRGRRGQRLPLPRGRRPFGAHKGYGLSLIDELVGAFIGGSLPTLRSRWSQGPPDEKRTPSFFFQAIKPEALDGGAFAQKRTQAVNVRAVIEDILGHGNTPGTMLPG